MTTLAEAMVAQQNSIRSAIRELFGRESALVALLREREGTMRSRLTVTFVVPAHVVLGAARKQAKYHASRAAVWTKTKAKAQKKLGRVDFARIGVTGGYQDVPVGVDAKTALLYRTAEAKVSEHQAKAGEFLQWVRAFERDQHMPKDLRLMNVELTVVDLAWFGLV